MPLNYLDIQEQVVQFGEIIQANVQRAKESLDHLRQLLNTYAERQSEVSARVELTRKSHPSLRCALPGNEALTKVYDPPETTIPDIYLMASDGSQIYPDRHSSVEYGAINTGLLSVRYHSPEQPAVITETKIYYPGIPPFDVQDLSEEMISFLRDIEERRLLSKKVLDVRHQHAVLNDGELPEVLALTDGPLDLFARPDEEGTQIRELLNRYLDSLLEIYKANSMIAGYIERPRASMLVRTLELMETPEDRLTKKGPLERIYPGISDVMLFAHLLKPGQRTGAFRLVSNTKSDYADRDPMLGLHFFYINVGFTQRNGEPLNVFARVEVPAWVANRPEKMAVIHQVLLDQAKILGTSPYPYLLHRAHETALVSFLEKEEIDRILVRQLLEQGLPVETTTQKSAVKRASRS